MQMLNQMLPLLLMVVVFYFFFIRPQARKQKEQNNFLNNLQKGSEVVTGSGIIGRINKIDDATITLEVEKGVYIQFTKPSISKELTDAFLKSTAVVK